MKFKKTWLQDLLGEDVPDGDIVQNDQIGNSRWTIDYELVFKFEDRLYKVWYSRGATECQDVSPFQYDEDEIECPEVFAKEKVITVYE